METAQYNIKVQRGASFSTQLEILEQSGAPFDFTGYTVEGHIRSFYDSTSPTAIFTCSVNTPPTSGTVAVTLHPSSSALLTGSCYFYDIRITSGSSVQYPLEGKAIVSPRVTR